jgi:hypothetical protein
MYIFSNLFLHKTNYFRFLKQILKEDYGLNKPPFLGSVKKRLKKEKVNFGA